MARSMTAYGRAHVTTDEGTFLIEIHSVNRKGLDIGIHLPKEFLCLDLFLRKYLSKEVKRGTITLRIIREDLNASRSTRHLGMPKLESMQQLYQEWERYARALGYEPREAISFDALLHHTLSLSSPAPQLHLKEELDKEIKGGVERAMDAFIEMKNSEGRVLVEDMKQRIEEIARKLKEVEKRAQGASQRFRDTLLERLDLKRHSASEVSGEEDRGLFMRELVLFADRVDVTEELIRLGSHVKQFLGKLLSDQELLGQELLGKELLFLIQEMSREINTIGAKSQDLKIIELILEMKSELEKVKEQDQNIE